MYPAIWRGCRKREMYHFGLVVGGVGEDHSRDSHDGDADEGESTADDLKEFGLHFEDDEREDEGGDDGASPHHLIDRPSDEIQSKKLQIGGQHIAEGRDGEFEPVEFK